MSDFGKTQLDASELHHPMHHPWYQALDFDHWFFASMAFERKLIHLKARPISAR
jgi:hypothetical protein